MNSTATTVTQWISPVDKNRKAPALIELISTNNWEQVLVFSRTKHGANRLAKQLDAANISAAAIHGNKSQGARTKALAEFKSGVVKVLVATDIAARGLDIDQLPHVVNFDLPNVPEDYVHRIGRTGRAGASGEAVSLVCADEFEHLAAVEHLIGKILERKELSGFSPVHPLPESDLSKKPSRKKPSQNRGGGHKDGQRSADNARGHKPQGKNKSHRSGSRTSRSTDSSSQGNAKSASTGSQGQRQGTTQGNNTPANSRPARRVRKRPATNTAR